MGEKKKPKHKDSKKKVVFSLAIVICLVIAVFIMMNIQEQSEEPETEIISQSTLEKIINVSDLSTFEAVYNGVAKVMNEEKPENIDYYVSYEAKVKAGVDFEKLDINLDDEGKIITVKIPEIEITDVDVDIATLDYMFINDKANTSTVSEEAYKKCIEDVTSKSSSESAIYELAKENACNIIEALIKPFVEQMDDEYILQIN